MKIPMLFSLLLLLLSSLALAKDGGFYQSGTLSEMTSVECGYDENGGKGFVGTVLGTDSQHKKTREALCPEYVLRTDRVIYRIRPKEEKHPALLPIGEKAQFRLKKDRMVLRVPEGDDKEREYVVISVRQTPESDGRVAENAKTK